MSKTEETLTKLQELVTKKFTDEYQSIFKQLQEDVAEIKSLYEEHKNNTESLIEKGCTVEKDNEATKTKLDQV